MNKLPYLHLISFSGAHATGKSTLLNDVANGLREYPATSVFTVESCSLRLFERIRDGSLVTPNGKIPKNYDDINRLGLRTFFQRQLPDALAMEVEATLLRAVEDRPLNESTYVIVDRWFTDIYAYTETEIRLAQTRASVLESCRVSLSSVLASCLTRALGFRLINVFVPLHASRFDADVSAKFRATCDRPRWERTCTSNWQRVVGPNSEPFVITASDRRERVAQLLARFSSVPNDQSAVSTAKPE